MKKPGKLRLAWCALLWLAPFAGHAAANATTNVAPHELVVMQWNVQNFYDTDNAPDNPGDDEYTPRGWRHWDPNRYALKVEHLASIVAAIKPDILGLEEVENRRVVVALADRLRDGYNLDYPYLVHRDSPDKRGIDNALLSRYPFTATNWLAAEPFQRETIVARFEPGGAALTVIVNHWKSNYGARIGNLSTRTREAQTVRRAVDEQIQTDPAAAVLVMGDFNWDSDTPAFTNALRALPPDAAIRTSDRTVLYNLSAGLSADQSGTYWYNSGKSWHSYDNILVTHALLSTNLPTPPLKTGEPPRGAWRVVPDSFRVVRDAPLLDDAGHPQPFNELRDRKTGKFRWITGYSDHLPVIVRLKCIY